VLVAESSSTRRRGLGARLRDDDAALVRRTQSGDQQAFAAIFERHHTPLLSYCRHMLSNRDDGEDALQQTFIKAHRALLAGTTPRELRPWLYAIARNCCLSAIAARRPTVPLEDRTPALAGLSEEVHRREDLRELLAGIGRLPEDQRSALLLAELDDLSHQAIATVLGCPVSRVKALVYQARSALIADRDARGTPCQDIREQLAVARGGELRRGPLRRHLSMCAGCRDFQFAVGAQRQSLASVLPVAPSAGLAAVILGHGSAHVAGAAGIGGAGAGVAPAGGAAGTSVGAAGAGTTATAGSGIVASATATTSTAVVGAGTGGGTSVGALLGGGLVTKLAVGGAVVALAAAGTVAVRQRPARAVSARVARARLASFAARSSELLHRGDSTEGLHGAAVTVPDTSEDSPSQLAPESPTALTGGSGAIGEADVDPFAGPASNGGAQALLMLTGASPPSVAATGVAGQPAVRAGQSSGGNSVRGRARRARAKLRRAALRRRARRLRKARRRVRLHKALRKAPHKALAHRRHAAVPKPPKPPEPATTPVTPPPARIRHRHAGSATTPLGAPAATTKGSEGNGTTTGAKRQHDPPATGTGAADTKVTGTDPETSTVATGKGKGKASSHSGTEKTSSPTGGGTAGTGTGTRPAGTGAGTEKAGSTTAKGKAAAGAGTERSSSGADGKQTAQGASGGKTDPETGSGDGSAAGTGDPTKASDTGRSASETSGAATTSVKRSSAHAKRHLVEEEQLPNL
jgi:RNA polymerase sigma factor (sigma-70 family)